jgi:two-component system sensor histidine kinase MprB
VAPVKRLTLAMEHVRRTRDLSERIQPASEDEIGQLAEGFNAMLDALQHSIGALDASVHAQRQLVADASHELRTPVTSMRTNIEVLRQQPDMPTAERQRLLDDVVEQAVELTALMNDLIELARGEQVDGEHEDVRLDLLVEEAVERARRHSPQTLFAVLLQPLLSSGAPQRLARAVNNLIDNSVAYSPAGAPVEIELRSTPVSIGANERPAGADGPPPGSIKANGRQPALPAGPARVAELTVRDHGPGIDADDLPHVFDRFYRGADARGRPGSGLGLAIVRQVAEQHGGSVCAERAGGGGTLMRLRLPGAEAAEHVERGEPDLAARA